MRPMLNRKPRAYLLVMLPLSIGGGLGIILALIHAYSRMHGISPAEVTDRNAMLITVPAFFLWMPLSLIISNFIIRMIPPLRKIANDFVSQTNSPGYEVTQKSLLKLFVGLAVVCMPLIVIGFILH